MNNSFWYHKDSEGVENVINLNLVYLVRVTSYLDGNYGVEFRTVTNGSVMACVTQDDYNYLMRRLGM